MPIVRGRTHALVACLGIAVAATLLPRASSEAPPAPERGRTVVATPAPEHRAEPVAVAAPAPAPAPAARTAIAPAAHAQGMIAYRDPETGEIGGMPPGTEFELEIESASPAFERTPDSAFEQVNLGRHGVMVELDETFHEYAIVRRGADGTLHYDCLPAPDAARLLRIPVSVTAPAAEE